jgi:hypothetical protein
MVVEHSITRPGKDRAEIIRSLLLLPLIPTYITGLSQAENFEKR